MLSPPPLGPRLDAAFTLARDLHATQRRKDTAIPYVAHLLGVASLVLDDGGDEDEAIAALLHDAVEDQGGAPTLARIRDQFGERVADIVAACSDTDVVPKPPWRARKEAYVAHLSDPREQQLWYHGALAAAFTELTDSPMVAELQRVVDELRTS